MAGFEKIDHKDSADRELKTQIENEVYAIVYKESEKVIGNFTIEPLPEFFTKNDYRKSKNGVILSFALSNSYQRKGLISEILEKMIHRKKFCSRIATGEYDAVIIGIPEVKEMDFLTSGFRNTVKQLDIKRISFAD